MIVALVRVPSLEGRANSVEEEETDVPMGGNESEQAPSQSTHKEVQEAIQVIPIFALVKPSLKIGSNSILEPGLVSRFVFASTGGFSSLQLSWHIPQGWAHVPRQQSSAATLRRTTNGRGETRKMFLAFYWLAVKEEPLFG